MNRNLVIGIWTLFGIAVALHFWIGGVVVETKLEEDQHYVLLRKDRQNWLPISFATYWAHIITKHAMLIVCIAAVSWAAWRWLRHGSYKN